MWLYLALKKRKLCNNEPRSSLSSSSSGMPSAEQEGMASGNMMSGDMWWLLIISVQPGFYFVNDCRYGLTNQTFAKPIHISHREAWDSPVTLADKPNAERFPVRIEVSIEDVLEVRHHCGHVRKDLVSRQGFSN